MITFRVDDVPEATERPKIKPSEETLASSLTGESLVDIGNVHPLLGAVHLAFAEHRPLVISPDAVWITIAQGVSQHVRLHAEEFRGRFVRHLGRREIAVAGLRLDEGVIRSFRNAMAQDLGEGIARLFVCDFSTTTEVDITASEIVMLETFSPYYQLAFYCICGIPEITLAGSVDDWKKIRSRIDVVRELGLEFWTRSLAPIADEWIRTAEGKPNVEFWKTIYKPAKAYGWDRILGWIARLYPYLKLGGQYQRLNSLLDYEIGKEPKPEGHFSTSGITTDDVMPGLSQVPVTVRDVGTDASRALLIRGGLVGVVEGQKGLEVRAGWDIVDDRDTMRHLIERIEHDHELKRSSGASDIAYAPDDLLQFWVQCEWARIFGWSIRPASETSRIDIGEFGMMVSFVRRVVDLDDGTFLGFVVNGIRGNAWVRMRADALRTMTTEGLDEVTGLPATTTQIITSEPLEQIPVIETSFVNLLLRALDGGRPNFARICSLKEALDRASVSV